MRIDLLLSGVLLLAPWLSAQTAAPVQEDRPHILIDTVGPDGWRIRLGPTNLGSLLESEKGRELWQPHTEPFFAMWQQLAGDEDTFAESRTRLLGYGGRMRMGLWLDPTGRRGNDPAACIAVVLEGDGRSDLAAIAKDLRATLYQTIPGEWKDVEIGGTEYTVRHNGELSVSAPMLDGERVIIAATNEGELALALQRARTLAESSPEKIKPNSPALRIEFDYAAILAAVMAKEPENDRAMMKMFGLDSVGTGTATLGTAGPRVQLAYEQKFTSDDRGLFGAFMPATKTIPSLLLATGEGTWTVGHFDCLHLYETLMDAAVATDIADEDPRARIKEEWGLDPATELLAHMTDDVMLWLPEAENFDESADKTTWSLTFRLKDEQAFRKSLFALLPKWRPFFQRERKESHEEVEVYRYGNLLSYDLWLAVGRNVLTIAGGGDAEERITQVLDRCKDLPAELPADKTMPQDFGPVKRYLPPGCHGYAVGSATNVISIPSSLWFTLLGWFTPLPGGGLDLDPDEDAERREALAELLREHRLDVARSATGFDNRTWHWRLYW